jgi:hypothetical protein
MPTKSIIFGTLLILLGVAGYIHGMTTGHASFTALIPAAVGLVMAILGAAARSNEGLRKHLMHVAVVVALLGFLASAGRLVMKISEFTLSVASASQIAMAAICLVFVIMAVSSFTSARRGV